MKRFLINIPTEVLEGYLRYGHIEGIMEAESIEDVRKELATNGVKNLGYDLLLDDYSVEGYELDYSSTEIEEL